MRKILIVGLGNVLLQDEGIGIHLLERLEKEGGLPDEVELIRGETCGLALLPSLDEASAIIFVDAADFEGETGQIRIFRGNEMQKERYTPLSVHDVGLRDLVSLVVLTSPSPPEIVLVGIKPKEVGAGLQISPEMQESIPFAVTALKEEVESLRMKLTEERK